MQGHQRLQLSKGVCWCWMLLQSGRADHQSAAMKRQMTVLLRCPPSHVCAGRCMQQ